MEEVLTAPPLQWSSKRLSALLQHASTDTSSNYYTTEGEVEIVSELEEERPMAAYSRSRLEDVQRSDSSATAFFVTFHCATMQMQVRVWINCLSLS